MFELIGIVRYPYPSRARARFIKKHGNTLEKKNYKYKHTCTHIYVYTYANICTFIIIITSPRLRVASGSSRRKTVHVRACPYN